MLSLLNKLLPSPDRLESTDRESDPSASIVVGLSERFPNPICSRTHTHTHTHTHTDRQRTRLNSRHTRLCHHQSSILSPHTTLSRSPDPSPPRVVGLSERSQNPICPQTHTHTHTHTH